MKSIDQHWREVSRILKKSGGLEDDDLSVFKNCFYNGAAVVLSEMINVADSRTKSDIVLTRMSKEVVKYNKEKMEKYNG